MPRRDVTAGELTLLNSGAYDEHWRVRVENGSGTMIDISGRLKEVQDLNFPNADAPIGTATLTFVRDKGDASASLAPLVDASTTYNREDDGTTINPLLKIGRDVTVEIAITAVGASRPADGSASWHEVLGGFVKQVSWPKRFGDVSIECHDRAYKLMRTYAEEVRTYDSGTTIEAAIQEVLDDNFGASTYTLVVDDVAGGGTTGSSLGPNFEAEIQPVWEICQSLAHSIGWVLWYRYDASGNPELTLTEPRRSKSVADYTFSLAQFQEITQLTVIEEDIRNVIVLKYLDSDGQQQTVTAEDSTSITKYGGIRRFMQLVEDEFSPIRTSGAANTLISAMMNDLKDPDADQAIETIGAWWAGDIAVDLYEFAANTYLYDNAQTFAPYAISISGRVGELSRATIRARGKPSGGSGQWHGRPTAGPNAPGNSPGLSGLEPVARDANSVTYNPTWTGTTAQLWIWENTVAASAAPVWPGAGQGDLTVLLTEGQFTIQRPATGNIKYVQVEARDANERPGQIWRFEVYSTLQGSLVVQLISLTFTEETDYATADILLKALDQDEAGGTLELWTNPGSVNNPDPTGAADASVAVTDEQTIGATGSGADVTTSALDDVRVPEGSAPAKTIYARLTASDGRSTGIIAWNTIKLPRQLGNNGQLVDGSVVAGMLIEGVQTFRDDIDFSATDNDTVEWTSGTLTKADGNTYSIGSGNTGNMTLPTYIYLDTDVSTTTLQTSTLAADATGDNVLFLCFAKPASSATQDAFFVPAVGVFGINEENLSPNSISETIIQDDSIATPKLQANSVTAAKIIAGAITAGKIAAGAVETDKLAANSVTAAKISVASLSAISADLGTITAGSIDAVTGNFAGDLTASTVDVSGRLALPNGYFIDSGGSDTVSTLGQLIIDSDPGNSNSTRISLLDEGSTLGNGDITLRWRTGTSSHADIVFLDASSTGGTESGSIEISANGTTRYIRLHSTA